MIKELNANGTDVMDSVGRTIQAMVDDTPLIRNLKNDNYLPDILSNIEEKFRSNQKI